MFWNLFFAPFLNALESGDIFNEVDAFVRNFFLVKMRLPKHAE